MAALLAVQSASCVAASLFFLLKIAVGAFLGFAVGAFPAWNSNSRWFQPQPRWFRFGPAGWLFSFSLPLSLSLSLSLPFFLLFSHMLAALFLFLSFPLLLSISLFLCSSLATVWRHPWFWNQSMSSLRGGIVGCRICELCGGILVFSAQDCSGGLSRFCSGGLSSLEL